MEEEDRLDLLLGGRLARLAGGVRQRCDRQQDADQYAAPRRRAAPSRSPYGLD
jgi:hypothetical protein